MQLAPGTTVGPYLIEEPLGSGAMGQVYRACDPRLGRRVALKILADAHTCDPEHLRRFEQEARATAALTHPNIVTIHDAGAHCEAPYLVTELLEGGTLRELLNSGALSPQRTVEIGLQLARGVAAAHAVKIVHRDLKPENLFVTTDGTLKILDFGLAKLRPQPMSGTEAPTLDTSLPGRILGTLGYMAPEQIRGEPVDERADLFAIGSLLWEMLNGIGAFARASAAETISSLLRDTPGPATGGRHHALDRLVHRCLEKEACDRFQTARDLSFALETALSRQAATERTVCLPENSIAVLPFTDMSPTRDQEYLCDGLAEELISALTPIDGLCIAARSSSFQFRGSAFDVRAAGERLGVATIVEGSVRKIGDRLRVNVQLVDVKDGYQRWSARFDRGLEDVFAIQDEIAESVATSLRGVLSPREEEALRRPAGAVESYQFFLRGRQLVHKFNRPGVEGGLQMFERAIELDPNYAPAWAGLADAHAWLYEWWGGNDENLNAADDASRKALELAPDLAEAHTSRGFTLALRGAYDEAEHAFERALTINANLYEALYCYARTAFAAGKIERSAELFRRAGETRREDFQSMILLGQSLRILNRDDEAMQAVLEGVRRVEQHLELNPTDPRGLSLGANALHDVGRTAQALRWSDRAISLYPDDSGVLINGACLRARVGMTEQAIDILERAFTQGSGKRDWIANDRDYDGLRDDPRFQALLNKLH